MNFTIEKMPKREENVEEIGGSSIEQMILMAVDVCMFLAAKCFFRKARNANKYAIHTDIGYGSLTDNN